MKSQPHVVVIKRYSYDDESFRYIMVDNKPNFASARRLASNIKNAIPKDIILVIPIDHISEPEKRARSVYAVNSIGGVVEITQKDYAPYEKSKGMSFSFYESCYLKQKVRLATMVSEVAHVNFIVPTLCECAKISVKHHENDISYDETILSNRVISDLQSMNKDDMNELFKSCEKFMMKYSKTNAKNFSIQKYYLAKGIYNLLHIPFGNTTVRGINATSEAFDCLFTSIDLFDKSSFNDFESIIEKNITPEFIAYAIAENHRISHE